MPLFEDPPNTSFLGKKTNLPLPLDLPELSSAAEKLIKRPLSGVVGLSLGFQAAFFPVWFTKAAVNYLAYILLRPFVIVTWI